jgi:hypothetical protein
MENALFAARSMPLWVPIPHNWNFMAPSGVVHRQYWTGSIQQYLRTVRQAVERCCVIVALMSAIQAANVCVQLADVFHVWSVLVIHRWSTAPRAPTKPIHNYFSIYAACVHLMYSTGHRKGF